MTTAVSLFSGCGGFDLGARRAGVSVLWANDVNKQAAETYQKHFPQVEFVTGDIRTIDKKQMPNADLLIGCYPCQGFSAAAQRRWRDLKERNLFENPDNFLFLEFIRAIPTVRPKFVFIENVGGLKSAADGWFFAAQKEMLEIVGYRVYSKTLNLKDYGAPQSRKRIFIVGVSSDLPFIYKFPAPTHGPGCSHKYRTLRDVIADLPEWPQGDYEDTAFHGHYLTRNRKKSWDSYSYTIVAHSHHVPLHPMGEPMRKIGIDHWELQGQFNRRLSWRECALLQTFDVNFEPAGNLSAKYMQIGNAVPPLMGEILVRPVIQYLSLLQMRSEWLNKAHLYIPENVLGWRKPII